MSNQESGSVHQESESSSQESGSSSQESRPSYQESGSSSQESRPSYQESGSSYQESRSSYQESGSSTQESGSSYQESGSSTQGSESSNQQSGSSSQESRPSYQESGSSYQESRPSYQESRSSYQESGSSTQGSESSNQESRPSYQESGSSTQGSESSHQESGSSSQESDSSNQESGSVHQESESSSQESGSSSQESGSSSQESGSSSQESEFPPHNQQSINVSNSINIKNRTDKITEEDIKIITGSDKVGVDKNTEEIFDTDKEKKDKKTEGITGNDKERTDKKTEGITGNDKERTDKKTERIIETDKKIKEKNTEEIAGTDKERIEQNNEGIIYTDKERTDKKTEGITGNDKERTDKKTEGITGNDKERTDKKTEGITGNDKERTDKKKEGITGNNKERTDKNTEEIAGTDKERIEQNTEGIAGTDKERIDIKTERIVGTDKERIEKNTERIVGTDKERIEKNTERIVDTDKERIDIETEGITGNDKQITDKNTEGITGSDKQIIDKNTEGITGSDKQIIDKNTEVIIGNDKERADKKTERIIDEYKERTNEYTEEIISTDKEKININTERNNDNKRTDKNIGEISNNEEERTDKITEKNKDINLELTDKNAEEANDSDNKRKDKNTDKNKDTDKKRTDENHNDENISDKNIIDKYSEYEINNNQVNYNKSSNLIESDKEYTNKSLTEKIDIDQIKNKEMNSNNYIFDSSVIEDSKTEAEESSSNLSESVLIKNDNKSETNKNYSDSPKTGINNENTIINNIIPQNLSDITNMNTDNYSSINKGKNDTIDTDESSHDKMTNKPSCTDKSCSNENKDISSDLNQILNNSLTILNEAKKRTNISISFRQLSNFNNLNKEITFMFFGLVTTTYQSKTQFPISVNLIKINGEMEDFTREADCVLESTVETIEGYSVQADFKCTITGLEEEYYSLRFNHSDFISGIPNDEILLNPVLTEEAIKLRKIIDYSLQENKGEDQIPSSFISLNIKDNCENGKLIIEGTLNKAVNNKLKFDLPLTYPEGVSMLCSLTSFEAGPSSIICRVDREINSQQILIEQTTITNEGEQILVITGIISKKNMTCENGLLREVEEKLNIGISFRKVNNFTSNGKNEFSFVLEAILSEEYKIDYNFILSIIVLIGNNKVEKNSNCSLHNYLTKNKFILGYFKCITKVSNEEYININFNKTESITISPYNTNINGIFGLDKYKLSPLLDITADDDEPISFQPKELVKIEDCWKKGKFKIIGTFNGKFEEKTFEFPMSYPSVIIKCKVEEAEANKEVEIICKLQSEFKDIKSLVIEPRIITKKHKEILFIEKNIIKNIAMSCKNYNKIKFDKAKKNQKASFSFLTISNPSVNSGLVTNFFIGMVRKPNEKFAEITIPINAKYSRNSLRELDESETSVTCDIAIQKGTTVFYECELPSKPLEVSIDYDKVENIAGLQENVDQLNCTLDYSNRDNFDQINKIPIVNITNINYLDCNDYGTFTIEGIIEGRLNKHNFSAEIPFSYPDSISFCKIKSNYNNIIMECQNQEKFPVSAIIFDQTYIKDTEGNILFKLNNYIYQKQFSCEVGILDSNLIKKIVSEPTISSTTLSSSKTYLTTPSSSSTALPSTPRTLPKLPNKESPSKSNSNVIIIVIVIIIIIVFALIFIGIIILIKKKKLCTKKPLKDESISDINSMITISNNSYYDKYDNNNL